MGGHQEVRIHDELMLRSLKISLRSDDIVSITDFGIIVQASDPSCSNSSRS